MEPEDNKAILQTLYQVAEVHRLLWKKEGHSEADMIHLDDIIPKLMKSYYNCFGEFNKSDCRFPKFHYLLHLTTIMMEWGSMRIVDGAHGEV